MTQAAEPPLSRSESVQAFQDLLIAAATGGERDADQFKRLRARLIRDPVVEPLLPSYVRTCRDISHFWSHIKLTKTYEARRRLLWDDFGTILSVLESQAPADVGVSEGLKALSAEAVHASWQRALDRRSTDPEAAITSARTLLESTCKCILDEAEVSYEDGADLPKLYRLTARVLNLAPDQHTEDVFRQILGGCQAVVEGLGAVRNKLSDAHGRGKNTVRPAPRHAELAVNLAGAAATFLVQTWKASQARSGLTSG